MLNIWIYAIRVRRAPRTSIRFSSLYQSANVLKSSRWLTAKRATIFALLVRQLLHCSFASTQFGPFNFIHSLIHPVVCIASPWFCHRIRIRIHFIDIEFVILLLLLVELYVVCRAFSKRKIDFIDVKIVRGSRDSYALSLSLTCVRQLFKHILNCKKFMQFLSQPSHLPAVGRLTVCDRL